MVLTYNPLYYINYIQYHNQRFTSMSLNKQAKVLTNQQINLVLLHLENQSRNPVRDQVIFLLSTKAGLRAIEISSLTWSMVTDASGALDNYIYLTNSASKGKSGRQIPINKQLKEVLQIHLEQQSKLKSFDPSSDFVVTTQRSKSTSSQAIVNMFQSWYRSLNLIGCSSHSGRRTFITNCSRKISSVGGSLRDIQYLAGHSSLQTTQRYIEGDTESKIKVVNLI